MEASPPVTGPGADDKSTFFSVPNETVVDSHLASGNSTLDTKTATLKIADSKMDPVAVNQDAFQANGDISANVNGHAEQNGDAIMTNGVASNKQPDQPTVDVAPTQEQPKDTPAQSSTPDVPPTESPAPKSEPTKTPDVADSAAEQPATDVAPTSNGVARPDETIPASAEPEVKAPTATSDAPAEPKPLTPPVESPINPPHPEQTEARSAVPSTENPAETGASAVPKLTPDQPQGDQEMPDAPALSPTKISREREEDTGDEPAAKRAKTGESQGDEQPKVPELAPAATPAKPEAPSGTDPSVITPLRKKFLVRTLQSLKRHPKGRLFKDPVDYVAMNIPTYPDVIKNPMDLSTMEKKLKADQYQKMDDLHADMQLMIYNTTTFNGPQHTVTLEGVALQQHFHDLLAKLPSPDEVELTPAQKKAGKKSAAPKTQPQREARAQAPKKGGAATAPKTFALGPAGMPVIRRDNADGRPKRSIHPPKNRDFPYNIKPKKKKFVWELKFCKEVLDELHKAKYFHFASPFYQPVDPVALNIPTYHSIIKKPMDLQTMSQKLEAGSYENAREFQADMMLMFKNCYKFNIEGDPVYMAGKELQNVFEHKWSQKARWLEAHQPASARHSSDEESDEDNESDEDQETLTELQRQIAEMSKQVAAIKQKKKTPPTTGKKGGAKGKGKNDAKKAAPKKDKKAKNRHPEKWITYHEKQLISNGISSLNEKQMHEALDIIQRNVPHLRGMDSAEIELDMDELPNEVLVMLLKFVKKHAPGPLEFDDEPVPEVMPAMAPTKPKKNKPMTKQEQESRIHALQKNLQSFAGGAAVSDEAPESSDDEEDSEESEEE